MADQGGAGGCGVKKKDTAEKESLEISIIMMRRGRRDGLENIERNKWTLKMKKNSNLKYKFEFFFSL